ncbi:hypothetical protein [Desulfoferrobacter suflitae]|uniref:hypothetical protein n=1 Tax=Desulfoferrobacter suflitae TaxID=2865782 RepID=UPI00216425E6|nr:hypothetical protein [Desulfoferrobacter suflitae]MCK8600478.1 hypothetical protein [Desulfoferrobacter suflitae]
MIPNCTEEEIACEAARNNYIRAAQMAASLGWSEEKVRELQWEALWQMALNRNVAGTLMLAQEYGISKSELQSYLEGRAERMRKEGENKALVACYDLRSRKYLTFEEWLESLLKRWLKIRL